MYFRFCTLILIIAIGFALGDAQAQVPAQGNQIQTCSISGRVTIDGKDAPNVVVSREPFIHIGTYQIPTTRTDGSGYFRFATACYADWNAVLHARDLEGKYVFSNRSGLLEWGIPVTVSHGATVTGVDFALTRGATVSGRVLDEKGHPVSGGHVTCLWFDPREAGWREKGAPVQTYRRGYFRFSGLPTGRYQILFRHDDADRYAVTYYPNTVDATKAITLVIKAGTEATNIDVQLSPRRTFSVSGRVIDGNTNQPLPNIPFEYYQSGDQGPGYPQKRNNFVGRSGAGGAIRLSGLLPGRYVAFIGGVEGAHDLYCDPAVFEIREEDVNGVEIRAYRGASISGRVIIEGATDPTAVSNLSFRRLGIDNFTPTSTAFVPIYQTAQIAEDGSFRFGGLRPGKTRIQLVNFPKVLTLWSVERNGMAQPDWVFDLAPGEQLAGVRVVLARSAGVIRGQIKVEGEESFSGKWMLFLKGVRGAPTLSFMDAVDGQGHFKLDGLAPGTYTVSASRFGKSEGASPFEDGMSGSQTVTLSNDKDATTLISIKKRE